jgi:hypothetical protein
MEEKEKDKKGFKRRQFQHRLPVLTWWCCSLTGPTVKNLRAAVNVRKAAGYTKKKDRKARCEMRRWPRPSSTCMSSSSAPRIEATVIWTKQGGLGTFDRCEAMRR